MPRFPASEVDFALKASLPFFFRDTISLGFSTSVLDIPYHNNVSSAVHPDRRSVFLSIRDW